MRLEYYMTRHQISLFEDKHVKRLNRLVDLIEEKTSKRSVIWGCLPVLENNPEELDNYLDIVESVNNDNLRGDIGMFTTYLLHNPESECNLGDYLKLLKNNLDRITKIIEKKETVGDQKKEFSAVSKIISHSPQNLEDYLNSKMI